MLPILAFSRTNAPFVDSSNLDVEAVDAPKRALADTRSAPKSCAHCGDPLGSDQVNAVDETPFCCAACRTVYSIIHEHGLERFYAIGGAVGIRTELQASDFAYLDQPDTLAQLCDYVDEHHLRLNLEAPAIHCASCLWLLERLPRLCPAVRRSQVDLLSRRITLVIDRDRGQLSEVVTWLTRIGYTPKLRLDAVADASAPQQAKAWRGERLGLKIGIAGFAAGNVMLLAVPEYFGLSAADAITWRPLFSWLSLTLALPVFAFSAQRYLQGAWRALRYRQLHVDIPIALGMFAMLFYSIYEVVMGHGAGYLDSLLGLIFFLLLGRYVQQLTHRSLVFDRDYRSYLPLAARVRRGGGVLAVRLDELVPGDIVEIGDKELIPADGTLIDGEAALDKSYITGEDRAERVEIGQLVQAGTRQLGKTIAVRLTGAVNASYLAQLWSEAAFRSAPEKRTSALFDTVGRQFALWTIVLAVATFAYWARTDMATALRASMAVLIVACPCAASLALPFVYGRLAGMAARAGLALRDTLVVERFADINACAFDKTGTLTRRDAVSLVTVLEPSPESTGLLLAIARQSTHPAAQAIVRSYGEAVEDHSAPSSQVGGVRLETDAVELTQVEEQIGLGMEAKFGHQILRLGRPDWAGGEDSATAGISCSLDGKVLASFHLEAPLRDGVENLVAFAKTRGPAYLISGDGDFERARWVQLFAESPGFGESRRTETANSDGQLAPQVLNFRQNPREKLHFIERLGTAGDGRKTLYVGDGLNDAGALQAAHVGVAVADESGGFNPACDAVLAAGAVSRFAELWRLLAGGRALVMGALALAILYNLVGLSFAVTGRLEPLVAAILMPLSSISVIGYAWLASWGWGRWVLRSPTNS